MTTTSTDAQGRSVKTSLNPDGSGTIVIETKDASGNVTSTQTETYGKGNVKTKCVIKNDKGEKVTEFHNNAEGKPVIAKTVIKDAKGEITGTEEAKYTYNAQGLKNNLEEITKDNKGEVIETNIISFEYNDKGQVIKLTAGREKNKEISMYGQVSKYKEKTSAVIEYEYDEQGNESKTVSTVKIGNKTETTTTDFENGKPVHIDTVEKKVIRTVDPKNGTEERTITVRGQKVKVKFRVEEKEVHSTTDMTYHENGKLATKKREKIDDFGNPSKTEEEYEEDGKTIKHKHTESITRGAKVVGDYTGPNIANRAGLPTTQVEYEEDGTTVKRTTTNNFDKDGVLISRDIVDSDGTTKHFDFAECDGKFNDIYYQVGRGDCYFLAGMRAIAQTDIGESILEKNVTVSTNDKGQKVYTVALPGAAQGREELINGSTKLPEDKVFIQGSYTVTEEELHQAALKAGSKYSAGDKDALLMEVVYEKYRTDVYKTFEANSLDKKKRYPGLGGYPSLANQGDYLSGGQIYDAIYILTGIKDESWKNPDGQKVPTLYVDSDLNMHILDDGAKDYQVKPDARRDEILKILIEDSKDGKLDHCAVGACFMVSSQEVNGQTQGRGGHAFTILKVTEDTVTLANPWNPDNPIEMSMEDFKKSVVHLTYTPLDEEAPHIQSPQTNTNDNTTTAEGTKHTVAKGQGYKRLIRQALKDQGIEPTAENMKKAMEEFEAANPGKVHIYKGRKKAWRGNKYLYANDTVIIPKFSFGTKSATETGT